MNQVADILKLAQVAQKEKVDAVLATVVRTEGSAYRQAGAIMLICADGRSVGMISGGCLEPHIIKRAFWLTRHGANVQVYQTGDEQADADDELNFGLGCHGKVHVLFERLSVAQPFLERISQVRKDQKPMIVATLIKSDNAQHIEFNPQIGMRIDIDVYQNSGKIRNIDGEKICSDHDSNLLDAATKLSAHQFIKNNADYIFIVNSAAKKQPKTTENLVKTEWFIQHIRPQTRLLICGAGNDVMPLVIMAKLQDWHVTVIDSRAQYATHARFPQADRVMCVALQDCDTLIELSHNAAVAVMSHSLSQDRARLAVLLAQAHVSYLGQLGPRYRTKRLIEEINASIPDASLLEKGIAKLYYPIGYKLGGDGAEALALSIMVQISAVTHGSINDDAHA